MIRLALLDRARHGGAAQQCPHAAPELADRERLRDVVVRAELEPDDLVELVVAGGEHDDRHLALGAQALADLEPVELRQHQVEHDEVDLLLGESRQSLLAVARLEHAEALALERVGEELLDGVLVVDEEDGRGVGHVGSAIGCLPASVPGDTRPTIALDGHRSAPDRAAPGASRLARATGQRAALPRDVAARRPTVARRRLQRRAPDAAAARLPAGVRRRGDEAARERACRATCPNRYPGALAAADWFRDQLRPYGLPVRTERFSAVIPGRGRVQMQNLVAEAVGRSPRTIVVMAHRDNDGRRPGANDNASGTAMLIQLARAYGTPPGFPAGALQPNHTILFVSTDGGAFGGLGAAEFAAHSPLRHDVGAVINLDSVGGKGAVRIALAGDTPRTPSGTLVETAAARVAAQTGRRAAATRPPAAARRPRLPVLPLRAGALPRPGRRRRHAHDRWRQAAGPDRRHARAAPRRNAQPGRALGPGPARHARRRARVRAGDLELPLPRLAPDPWLGGRARADRLPASVPRRRGRPVRALPAPADPARARAARLPQPARSSGSGWWGSSSSSPSSASGPTAHRDRSRRAAPPRPTGRRSG